MKKLHQTALICLMSGLAMSSYAVAKHATAHRHHKSKVMQVASQNVPININQANQKTLENIKGIGPKRAEAIIQYRNKHGDFKNINDLTSVKGIGSKRLAKISTQLKV